MSQTDEDRQVVSLLALPATCGTPDCWARADFFVRKICCPANTMMFCGPCLVEEAEWFNTRPAGVTCRVCRRSWPAPIRHGDLHTVQGVR